MNKDVIYIDVDDDITAIISKVKGAKEKIVALVPPKRIGVLQSAVNLRLLNRAAEQSGRRLVLISNNNALHALAASASIPVAKNLQSKPEVPTADALADDSEDDVIDGANLPIGEHAKQAGDDVPSSSEAAGATPVITDSVLSSLPDDDKTSPEATAAPTKKSAKKGPRVPNFNSFRKKLLLGGVALVALICFLVWAIVFAPKATVLVSAKTSDSPVNVDATAVADGKTDIESSVISAVTAEISDDQSVDFTATGTKNKGKTATGTVEFSNSSLTDKTVASGTKLSSSEGLTFTTNQSVTVPAGSVNCPTVFTCSGASGKQSVSVTATDNGAKYNSQSGDVSGEPDGVNGQFESPTSGGTDKIVKVVTALDVQKAKQELVDGDQDDKKEQLTTEFEGNVRPIGESFDVAYEDVESSPGVGEEADSGNAALSATVVYTMFGLETGELNSFIEKNIKKELDNSNTQQVYKSGADEAEFQEVKNTQDGVAFTLIATAQVGPKLDKDQIKEEAKGRRFGDIQNSIQQISGVENVDVKFFPFWVNTVPDDTEKITVEFKIDDK